jgi:hypothetical protein
MCDSADTVSAARGAQGYGTWGERLQAGVLVTMIVVAVYAAALIAAIAAMVAFTRQGCGVTQTGPCHTFEFVGYVAFAFVIELLLCVALAVVSSIRERGRKMTQSS